MVLVYMHLIAYSLVYSKAGRKKRIFAKASFHVLEPRLLMTVHDTMMIMIMKMLPYQLPLLAVSIRWDLNKKKHEKDFLGTPTIYIASTIKPTRIFKYMRDKIIHGVSVTIGVEQ
jgi:hypothetical protein